MDFCCERLLYSSISWIIFFLFALVKEASRKIAERERAEGRAVERRRAEEGKQCEDGGGKRGGRRVDYCRACINKLWM